MSTNFLALPVELRNKVYEQLLVLQDPVACPTCTWLVQSRALALGLLRGNKSVHLEASSILYTQNRFDFIMCTSEHINVFLEQIGRKNASCIQHIIIDFPKFRSLDLRYTTLEDDSVRVLAKIQSDCATLVTLTMSLHSANAIQEDFNVLDFPKIFELVDPYLRTILSLRKIIINVYEDDLSDHIQQQMNNHGWIVSKQNIWKNQSLIDLPLLLKMRIVVNDFGGSGGLAASALANNLQELISIADVD